MTARITQSLVDQATVWAKTNPGSEMVGIFFFPKVNRLLVGGPRFVRLPNRHPSPLTKFKIDYDDIEASLYDMYDDLVVPGEITLFHTHPAGPGYPSRDDHQVIEIYEKNLDGHFAWRLTEKHLILSLADDSWWWFDMVDYGRIGWEWPA